MKRGNLLFVLVLFVSLALPSVAFATVGPPPFPSDDTTARRHAMLVAEARADADLLIQHVTLLSVYSGTWLHDQDIVVAGERVAWTGPSGAWRGTANKIVNAYGYSAVPGFVESHNHLESAHVTQFGKLLLPFGTTSNFEASHEFGNVNGEMNARFFLMGYEAGDPFKVFPQLGSAVPPTPFEHTGPGSYYDYTAITTHMAEHPWVAGLGEVMDDPSVRFPDHPGYDRIWQAIQGAYDSRGRVEGHLSGVTDLARINSLVAAGYSSDHSAKQGPEAWDKLNRGIDLQLSGGDGNAQAKYNEVIGYLMRMGLTDWSHVSVTTDDRPVENVYKYGAQDRNIRMAIQAGMPVIAAYQAATLNPAVHWRYDHLIGSITPGRYADVVLLRGDPANVDVYQVYANGQLVAQNGNLVIDIPTVDWPEWATNTMNIGRELTATDFAILAPTGAITVTAAILAPFYRESDFMTAEMSVQDGLVQRDIPQSLSKFCIVDRYNAQAEPVACMFWKNVGPKEPNAAVASSVAHDHHNIWVLGSSDEAMALAVNRLAEIGGGWALVQNGEVLDDAAFEICGLMSAREPREIADDMVELWDNVASMSWLGVAVTEDNPSYATLAVNLVYRQIFATLTCTPWKWVLVAPWEDCRSGLRNVLTGECHEVVW